MWASILHSKLPHVVALYLEVITHHYQREGQKNSTGWGADHIVARCDETAIRPMSQRQVADLKALFTGTELFQRAIDGRLRHASIRGVAWRFFLGCLTGAPEGWLEQQQELQIEYDSLRVEHSVDLHPTSDDELDLSINNPLSVDEASPYAKYFAGSHLRDEIQKDLTRLHPGNAFYARPDVQRLMERVLFVWCKSNPELSYRQGMHELLAPIIFLFFEEKPPQAPDPAANDPTIVTLMDPVIFISLYLHKRE